MKPLTLADLRLTEDEYWAAEFQPSQSPVLSPERVCDAQIAKALGVLWDEAKVTAVSLRLLRGSTSQVMAEHMLELAGSFGTALLRFGLTWPPVSEPERPTATPGRTQHEGRSRSGVRGGSGRKQAAKRKGA